MAAVSDFILGEAWRLLITEDEKVLGAGAHRRVYACRLLPDLVVKIESDAGSFRNQTESLVWESAVYVDHVAAWLAPCRWISPCGSILLMDRTEPLAASEYPTHVPAWMTDIKPHNFGRLPDGRIVQHDYANNLLLERGMTKRMRKVKEWKHMPNSF